MYNSIQLSSISEISLKKYLIRHPQWSYPSENNLVWINYVLFSFPWKRYDECSITTKIKINNPRDFENIFSVGISCTTILSFWSLRSFAMHIMLRTLYFQHYLPSWRSVLLKATKKNTITHWRDVVLIKRRTQRLRFMGHIKPK